MIKIYVIACNRPDLISYQYNSIKKYIRDDFEYIVINNARSGVRIPDCSFQTFFTESDKEISSLCNELNIKCIDAPNKDINIPSGSHAHAYAVQWLWDNYISIDDCISMIIDHDMIFIKDVSIIDMMRGYNISYIPSYRYDSVYQSEEDRGSIGLKYIWPNFFIVDAPKIPNPSELKFGVGVFNGHPCDSGGESFSYLIKYEEELNVKYMDYFSLQRDVSIPGDRHSPPEGHIEMGINGCAVMYINFSNNEIDKIIGYQESNKRTFPHQKERENYWEYIYDCFTYVMNFAKKFEFPKPSYIDLVKFDDNDIEDAFILHYKSASGGYIWMNEEYDKNKVNALNKVLNEEIK